MLDKIAVYNSEGQHTEDLPLGELPLVQDKGYDAVFSVVDAYLSNNRAGTSSAKTRSEKRGGGRKPYRQKGTGRARAGSVRSPLWVGGGVAHGPKPRSYRKKVNKKVKQLALRRAFTERLSDGGVSVIENITFESPRTKDMRSILQAVEAESDTLLVLAESDKNIKKSVRNLESVLAAESDTVNTYWLLKFDNVVFTKSAWEKFTSRLQREIRK